MHQKFGESILSVFYLMPGLFEKLRVMAEHYFAGKINKLLIGADK
jgi:hypothetical protein